MIYAYVGLSLGTSWHDIKLNPGGIGIVRHRMWHNLSVGAPFTIYLRTDWPSPRIGFSLIPMVETLEWSVKKISSVQPNFYMPLNFRLIGSIHVGMDLMQINKEL